MNNLTLEEWARDTFARRDEVVTRAEFDRDTAALVKALDDDTRLLRAQLAALEEWKANLIGRGIAFTLIGAVLIAVCASVITRLIFGGS